MKLFKLFFAATFLSIFLYGCLQVDTKVKLNNDGSGTIEETVMVKNEIVNMLKEFAMAFDSTKTEDFNMFNETELQNKSSDYGEGVEYKSGEKIVNDNYQGYKVIYSFKDINKVKLNPSPDAKMPMGESEEGAVDNDYVKFEFKKGSPSVLKIIFPEEQLAENTQEVEESEVTPDSVDAEQMNKLIEMFDGMRISLNLKVDGEVKETDASYVNGNEIILMDVDFAEIIKNKEILEAMGKSKQMTRENFREMTKDIPGIKIEVKENIIVKFR
jgi:hypothetical protein